MGRKRIIEEIEDSSEEETMGKGSNESLNDQAEISESQSKKQKTKKPLPPGYVCNACKAVDDHAIYDCPLKIKKKDMESGKVEGTPARSFPKKSRSSSEDHQDEIDTTSGHQTEKNEFSLFVSGLPFDTNRLEFFKFVQKAVHESTPDYTLRLAAKDIVLLNFPDNHDRCNGLGYINCSIKEDYDKCLEVLNGLKYGKLNLSVSLSAPNPKKDSKSFSESKKNNRNQRRKKNNKEEGEVSATARRCYRCGQAHDPKTCTNPRICYRCRGTDHISSDCPKKKPNSV